MIILCVPQPLSFKPEGKEKAAYSGRSPGSWVIVHHPFPSHRATVGFCDVLSIHSGGTASDLHRTSLFTLQLQGPEYVDELFSCRVQYNSIMKQKRKIGNLFLPKPNHPARLYNQFRFISAVFANIDHTAGKNQILSLDSDQLILYIRLLVQIVGLDFFERLHDGISDLHPFIFP